MLATKREPWGAHDVIPQWMQKRQLKAFAIRGTTHVLQSANAELQDKDETDDSAGA
jgi:hypothetical protein